jgi:hypothetical protein
MIKQQKAVKAFWKNPVFTFKTINQEIVLSNFRKIQANACYLANNPNNGQRVS